MFIFAFTHYRHVRFPLKFWLQLRKRMLNQEDLASDLAWQVQMDNVFKHQ